MIIKKLEPPALDSRFPTTGAENVKPMQEWAESATEKINEIIEAVNHVLGGAYS